MGVSIVSVPMKACYPAYRGSKKGSEWKSLAEPVAFTIEADDGEGAADLKVTLYQGYVFDGASIPRALWRVCGHPFESPRDGAALIHDWCYSTKFVTRSQADEIYRLALVAFGVSKWRAWTEWAALRACGWRAWGKSGTSDWTNAYKHSSVYVGGRLVQLDKSLDLDRAFTVMREAEA